MKINQVQDAYHISCIVHLVSRIIHHFLSFNTEIPGSSSPPKNSSEAPPPVDIWIISESNTSAFLIAAMVSPPPTTVVVPRHVASAMARAMCAVPDAKSSISKTPIGPFQKIAPVSLISDIYL